MLKNIWILRAFNLNIYKVEHHIHIYQQYFLWPHTTETTQTTQTESDYLGIRALVDRSRIIHSALSRHLPIILVTVRGSGNLSTRVHGSLHSHVRFYLVGRGRYFSKFSLTGLYCIERKGNWRTMDWKGSGLGLIEALCCICLKILRKAE